MSSDRIDSQTAFADLQDGELMSEEDVERARTWARSRGAKYVEVYVCDVFQKRIEVGEATPC